MSGSASCGLRVVAVIAMAVVLALTGTPGVGRAFAASPDASAGARNVRTVTLITGDRVSVAPDGSIAGVQRAEGRERASLEHPAEPGTVSLRAGLTDRDGNTLVQTVERAYRTVR
ncbi:hypothetical protein [Streptomyces sp. T028]|uniref:hypothetical protein n=1 Tax=Streptomyces sp. T028 TaxID=3394379 RepID=UPI003A84C9A5